MQGLGGLAFIGFDAIRPSSVSAEQPLPSAARGMASNMTPTTPQKAPASIVRQWIARSTLIAARIFHE